MLWTLLYSTTVTGIVTLLLLKRGHNNVCKTFSDYYTDRDNNANCYHNPDAHLTADGIIKRHGYPVEIHNATTEDGYILTVFRISYGKTSSAHHKSLNKQRQPIFLLHGIAMNSDSFINIGKKSLGFILADAGYDVWLGNLRGTKYARNHVNLTVSDKRFWDFSFHEMGIYDAKVQVDLVTRITKQKIVYIGYSLGAATAFIYGSTFPEIAEEKIKLLVCLAPPIYGITWKSLTKHLFPFWPVLEIVAEWFANGMLYLRIMPPHALRSFLCLPYPFQMRICQVFDMLTWGFDYEQNDPETLPITLLQNTDATSIKTITHMVQLVNSGGKFKQFDYGADFNRRLYGSYNSPEYNLSSFRVPVYLIRGENDLLVSKENVEALNASLPEKVKSHDIYVVKHKGFNHGDFLQAKDVDSLVYNHILEFIRRF